MTISYFFGTVDSQKSLLLFNQVNFAQKYKVSITVIYPNVFYVYNSGSFKKNKICIDEQDCLTKEVILYPNEIRKIKETSIYTIYHSHLFLLEELKDIIKYIYKINPFALVSFIGLERDYTGEFFDSHNYLLGVANFTERMYSICSVCGEEATFNQAIMFNTEAGYVPTDSLLKINYEPRCKECYITPKEVIDE